MISKTLHPTFLINFAQRCLSTSVLQYSKGSAELKKDDLKQEQEKEESIQPSKTWLSKIMGTGSNRIDVGTESHSNRLADNKAVFELQRHKVRPECMDQYLEEFSNFLQMAERWKTGGKLVGSWTVEVGDLDEAIHIWKYPGGYKTLDRHKAILRNEMEFKEFRSRRNKLLRKRINTLMLAFSFWCDVQQRPGKNIYELRSYTLKPGTMIDWGNSWMHGLKHRQENQESVAGFFSHVGHLYEAHHLWAYESMADREEVRDSAWSKDGWSECVANTVPLVRHMVSRILIPTRFSPLQ